MRIGPRSSGAPGSIATSLATGSNLSKMMPCNYLKELVPPEGIARYTQEPIDVLIAA
jgi:hypothetical protein